MTNDEMNENLDANASADGDRSLTRRRFLKRGAIAGLGAAALYIAPSMSSTRAKRAYAGITGGDKCTDDEAPAVDSLTTSGTMITSGSVPEIIIDNRTGGSITTVVSDNHSLARVSIGLIAHGADHVIDIPCHEERTSETVTWNIAPDELPIPGFDEKWPGFVWVTDCCGNEIFHDFSFTLINS